jgi:sarcosine oxidase
MFTNAPDGHFIVDLHPEFPQVSFASACSGHGYKFASVIGEIVADLAQRRSSRHDISLFALSRFGGRMSALHRDKVELIQRGLPGAETHAPLPSGGQYSRQAPTWQAGDIRPFW